MTNRYLWLAALVSLLLLILRQSLFIDQVQVPYKNEMLQAQLLSSQWKTIVESEKAKLGILNTEGISSPSQNDNMAGEVIGDEYTPVTSTLGSLEAKQLSNNLLFSALLVRLIHESGVDTAKTIGVLASGSFPALSIQTFAALQALHKKAVIISSLGASSYGANQPGALWLDMENWIRNKGGCIYQSDLITYGAEGDTGGGLMDEGRIAFDESLKRNARTCFIPKSVEQSIEKKVDLLKKNDIGLLINIGGNQSALGYCAHAELIPNGLHKEINSCSHKERGVISRISESGIPFIHLLNLKNLALKYTITDNVTTPDHPVFFEAKTNKTRIVLAFALLAGLLFMHHRALQKQRI